MKSVYAFAIRYSRTTSVVEDFTELLLLNGKIIYEVMLVRLSYQYRFSHVEVKAMPLY